MKMSYVRENASIEFDFVYQAKIQIRMPRPEVKKQQFNFACQARIQLWVP